MLPQDIERIMKKNEKYARMLEEYDRTGHLPIEKVRRSFTLKEMNVTKLKRLSKEKRKSMSDMIDKFIENA